MVQTLVPYLRRPVYRHGATVTFDHRGESSLTPVQVKVLDRLIKADATLEDLVDIAVGEGDATREGARERMMEAYSRPDNVAGIVALDLAEEYDIIAVDQGYGGVYVHTVELVAMLRERYRVLLISPEDPLFEDSRHADDLTVPLLKQTDPSISYFSFVQIVRAVIAKCRSKLLFLSHRSQSLFLFDRVQNQPTIIYCDGFFDGAFRFSEQFSLPTGESEDARILDELHFILGNSQPGFFGFLAGPHVNTAMLKAGYAALSRAKENWCWGLGQARGFQDAFPHLRDRVLFEPPFTNEGLFHPERVARERVVLFTTTMHNIEKKGLPELVKAMEQMPEVRVRCVVRQPDRLPPIPTAVRLRMTMGAVKKPEMVDLYHRVWLNCRTSREESSPLSILEAMSCEVPQVISPVVADQIPILEDGRTGFIVDPDDTDRLVRSVRAILEDPELRDAMGKECRRRVLEYSLGKRIGRFERYLS